MTAALAFALRNWKLIVGGLGLALLGLWLAIATADARHWHKKYDAEAAAHRLTIAKVKAATAQARADDEAHARAVQTADGKITQENQNALESQLADARAVAADYARRMRAARPAACGVGQAGVSPAPDPTGGAAEPGRDALIPETDLGVCAANTVLAKGWQAWWAQASKVER